VGVFIDRYCWFLGRFSCCTDLVGFPKLGIEPPQWRGKVELHRAWFFSPMWLDLVVEGKKQP
jgi:hypothetical protein